MLRIVKTNRCVSQEATSFFEICLHANLTFVELGSKPCHSLIVGDFLAHTVRIGDSVYPAQHVSELLTQSPAVLAAQCLTDTRNCLLYTSDAADDADGVDLGGRRIIKKIFFSSRRRHTR